MRMKARNFPHPVLNPVSDDFQNGYFKGIVSEISEEDEQLHFKISLDLNNEDLNQLIQSKEAKFSVHFECISTMQRFSFSSSVLEFVVFIDKKLLNKKIDVNFFILAAEDIHEYTNKDAHIDYDSLAFKIQKGDILAFGVSQTIQIEKEPLSDTSSIFKISKTSKADAPSIEVDFLENQIEIIIPELVYEKIAKLQQYGDDCNKVLISMLYLPALIDVLFNIQSIALNDEYELENISTRDWYRTLEKQLQKKGYVITNLSPEKITQISYDLINLEPDASLVALENIVDYEEDENL